MQIGTLASETGLSRDALRFYEERGLIQSIRSANSYRTYAPETVQLVGYIRTAQSLGFTLAEIGENLPALWSSNTPVTAVAELLAEKVNLIDRKIEDLTALKQALLDRVAQTCPLLAHAGC
jgi:MerR family transcriptional regulator, copper efflux regulator